MTDNDAPRPGGFVGPLIELYRLNTGYALLPDRGRWWFHCRDSRHSRRTVRSDLPWIRLNTFNWPERLRMKIYQMTDISERGRVEYCLVLLNYLLLSLYHVQLGEGFWNKSLAFYNNVRSGCCMLRSSCFLLNLRITSVLPIWNSSETWSFTRLVSD